MLDAKEIIFQGIFLWHSVGSGRDETFLGLFYCPSMLEAELVLLVQT